MMLLQLCDCWGFRIITGSYNILQFIVYQSLCFLNQVWILFEDNVNTPLLSGLKAIGSCYQKIYSGCQECVNKPINILY